MNKILKLTLAALFLPLTAITAADRFVDFNKGDRLLCSEGSKVTISVDDNDNVGVKIAARNLVTDIQKVCAANATIVTQQDADIIVGTIGQSKAIDKLVKSGVIDARQLKGKREKYIITTTDNALVIAGSDRRGTIFGIYELSEQMGVSPWYYWMDVPAERHSNVYINKGMFTDGEPVVRYRGIFLNDEAPCLTSWVNNTFGTKYGGHKFYEKVFELVLRLKGNFIWPAMWGWAFYDDDPLNMKTADDMGVIVGTSHHEPMSRSQQEWHRPKTKGAWNYATNKDMLDEFWLGGVQRNSHTEDIITIGMRGDGDEAMSEERNVKLMESIVENQRRLIAKAHKKPAKEVPQVWALYKEVMDYYDDGMKVPEDVTMLLCDDNWGNVRRVPTAKNRNRKGGWGLYYHVDYVGAPRNSKWLNVTSPASMWEQLTLAHEYGIDRLWILNVGDLKPMEYPIQLFMDMAWNPDAVASRSNGRVSLMPHVEQFCARQFGQCHAAEAASILEQQTRYASRCTAEMLDANTYCLESGEWAQVVSDFNNLELRAMRQYSQLPEKYRDAYRQLILFPVQAYANLYNMYYAQAQNRKLFAEGNPECNRWADMVEKCFRRDSILMAEYNNDIAGGKWRGMMTQKHIGYTSWNDNFPHEILPKTDRIVAHSATQFVAHSRKTANSSGYIALDAENFVAAKNADSGAEWTIIEGLGRNKSGVTLMPRTKAVDGACLSYSFDMGDTHCDSITVHIITRSTLDIFNKGGMTYSVSIDNGTPVTVNFNADLNESPENIYTTYYPTIARRVVEKTVKLPVTLNTEHSTQNTIHTLTFTPNDPAIVIENIVIDLGGYTPQYLFK